MFSGARRSAYELNPSAPTPFAASLRASDRWKLVHSRASSSPCPSRRPAQVVHSSFIMRVAVTVLAQPSRWLASPYACACARTGAAPRTISPCTSVVTPLISTSLPAPSRPRFPIARASMSNMPCTTTPPVLVLVITSRISASISSTCTCAPSALVRRRSYFRILRSHIVTSAVRRSSCVIPPACMTASSSGCIEMRDLACIPRGM